MHQAVSASLLLTAAEVVQQDDPKRVMSLVTERIDALFRDERVVFAEGLAAENMSQLQGAAYLAGLEYGPSQYAQLAIFRTAPLESETKASLDAFFGIARQWLAALAEVSDREAELQQLLGKDPLTRLLTGRDLARQMSAALEEASPGGEKLAFLHIDLIGFRAVNEQLGDEMGDELLFALSEKLLRAVRDGDLVGRLGPDEFGILLRDMSTDRALQGVMAKFEAIMESPPIPTELWNGARIALVLSPDDGQTAQALMDKTRAALAAAKQKAPKQQGRV
ncbi:MAG: GGDEF domain-containing protein [Burkholderiaceae bacterium]